MRRTRGDFSIKKEVVSRRGRRAERGKNVDQATGKRATINGKTR
jgi:hypothetical protein